jgi:hypothetical protein
MGNGALTWHLPAAWMVAFLIAGCATVPKDPSHAGREPEVPTASAEERAGVAVVALRTTAGGRLLDFRFRVIDPEKAAPLLSRSAFAYLVVPATGAKMLVPNTKVGNIRQTTRRPEEGRVYFMFFQDVGGQVHTGDQVTVVIGEHRFEHLTVQ